jgi:tRNA G18 (ribose-2'-O)-methylase SpoU
VTDPSDPRLADYVGLTDVQRRKRMEPAGGIFIAEGEKVIERALAAGYPLRSVLLEEKWLHTVPARALAADASLYVGDRELLEQITGYAVHRGALAVMERLPLPPVESIVDAAALLVVLEDINNHTNIGAIFRSAAGLGADGVLLSPTCADPLYRRSVRVSMGGVFSLPYARLQTWPDPLVFLREQGFTVLALTPAADAVGIDDVPAPRLQRCALLLGAEGPGLTTESADLAALRVRIPMANGVDSLNVAAAAAVACYAVARRREAPPRDLR